MFNILKITLFILIFIVFNIGKTFADTEIKRGYITVIRANNTGGECYLRLSKQVGGESLQVGYWNCNTYYGGVLFEIARNAKIQNTEVVVAFDKYEEGSKTVYRIKMLFSDF